MVLLVFCKYSYCQMFMIKCYKQHRHILYMKHETSIFVNEKLNTYIKKQGTTFIRSETLQIDLFVHVSESMSTNYFSKYC